MAYNYIMHKFHNSPRGNQTQQFTTPCASCSTCTSCYCTTCGQYHCNPPWLPPYAPHNYPCDAANNKPSNANASRPGPPKNRVAMRSRSTARLDRGDTLYRGRAADLAHLSGTGGGYNRKSRDHSPPYTCCSSSGQPQADPEEERRRGQPEPWHVAAPCCDIDRLMTLVRRTVAGAPEEGHPCAPDSQGRCDQDWAWYWQQACDWDRECESRDDYPLEDATDSRDSVTSLCSEEDTEVRQIYVHPSVRRRRAQRGSARVRNSASCRRGLRMYPEEVKQQRSDEKGVQCQLDIPTDFCVCSKCVCERCCRKVVCKCDRIHCCKCSKLKSMVDRQARSSKTCRCPRRSRCRNASSSRRRFNSSPVLTSERNCDQSCYDASENRPPTY